MKILSVLTVSVSLLLATSCSKHTHVHHNGKMPPGQAKKVTGAKSAKAYAPGQQKKKNK